MEVVALPPWTGCTEVIDLEGSANQVSSRRVAFAGLKQVVCPGGDVFIAYYAELNFSSADHSFGKTTGEWVVFGSENPDISGGGGTLKGTSRDCPDCIVDTFTGRVY